MTLLKSWRVYIEVGFVMSKTLVISNPERVTMVTGVGSWATLTTCPALGNIDTRCRPNNHKLFLVASYWHRGYQSMVYILAWTETTLTHWCKGRNLPHNKSLIV